jgi:hypothetical protein
MSTGRRGSTVAWICAACLVVLALIVATAVVIAHAGSEQATADPSVSTPATPTASASPLVLPVPALRRLTPPDMVVRLPRSTNASAAEHLAVLPGVRSVALADRGKIRLGHLRLQVLGVPLATIRGFTPSLTATSTALWHSVASGEITVGYANSRPVSQQLGDTLVAHGEHGKSAPLRIGAFATIGLPGAQAMVSRPVARSLGLAVNREVMVAAPKLSLATLRSDVHAVFGASQPSAVEQLCAGDHPGLLPRALSPRRAHLSGPAVDGPRRDRNRRDR